MASSSILRLSLILPGPSIVRLLAMLRGAEDVDDVDARMIRMMTMRNMARRMCAKSLFLLLSQQPEIAELLLPRQFGGLHRVTTTSPICTWSNVVT